MQQYIYKEPDYAGGFTYTCIEDNHIVRRDNNWNILAVKPIDYIEKGLKTKHGIVEGIVNDRVMLKSLSGERYTCDRYLLNCSIIKEKQQETALRKSYVQRFRGGGVMNKGMFNLPNIFRRKSSLTGTTPNPNPEGSNTTGVAWNVKGGQKPGHKYIERRPSKTNPDKYIYLYELPNGDREWRDDAGNEVEETQGETLNDYNVGDFVKVNDDHYRVESASDNYLGLVDNQGRKFHIDKAKMRQIAEYENTLNIGDTYQKEGSLFDGMKIVGISDQYLLLRSKDGNSQHLVNRADTVKKTEVANPYEFDEQYREDQKDFAKAGYIQTDINKWEQNIVLGYNTVKHEMGFSRDTGKWYNKYNDKDEYVLQFDGRLYNLRGMHFNGSVIVQDRETGEEYLATKAEIAAGRPIQESTNRVDVGGEQTKFWEGDPNADIFEAVNSIKDRNATFEDIAEITGRDIQDVKETVFDLVNALELNNEGNDWTGSGSISIGKESADRKLARKKPKTEKKSKKNKGIEDVVRPAEPSKEMMESASRREALLQNPDYISGRTRLEGEGFSIAGDDALMTKKTDVNGSKYVIEKKFNPETNRWEGRVARGRYKTLKVEGKIYTITDITDTGVEVIDPAPDGTVFGKSYSWEDLERLNGKRIFDPLDSIGLVSAKAPAKIYFADKEEYSEEASYEIIDSADLIASHNPDGSINPKYTITGAQNRDRSDKRSQSQFTSIATTPIFAKLSDSNDVSGSPIVDQNYNVIAGNGRAIGLELHYANGGNSYKEELVKNAEKFGFDPKEVSSMDAPILVRRVNVTPERAVDLGNISNRETQESQTATEKARSIARTIKPRTFEKLSELISKDVSDGEMTLSQLIQRRGSDIALFLIREGVIFENEAGNYYNVAEGKVDTDTQRTALAKLITQLAIGEASDSFNKISAAAIKGISAATPLIFSLKNKPGDLSNDLSDAILLARMHLMKSDSDVESGSSRPLKREDTKSFLELQASDMFNPNNPSPRAIAIYESLMKDKQTAITDKILSYGKKLQGDMFEEAKTPEEAFSESFKINYPDGLFPGNTDYKVTHKESEEPGIKIDKAEKKAGQPKTEKQPVKQQPEEVKPKEEPKAYRKISPSEYSLTVTDPKTGKEEPSPLSDVPASEISTGDLEAFIKHHAAQAGFPNASSLDVLAFYQKHKDKNPTLEQLAIKVAMQAITARASDSTRFFEPLKVKKEQPKTEAPEKPKDSSEKTFMEMLDDIPTENTSKTLGTIFDEDPAPSKTDKFNEKDYEGHLNNINKRINNARSLNDLEMISPNDIYTTNDKAREYIYDKVNEAKKKRELGIVSEKYNNQTNSIMGSNTPAQIDERMQQYEKDHKLDMQHIHNNSPERGSHAEAEYSKMKQTAESRKKEILEGSKRMLPELKKTAEKYAKNVPEGMVDEIIDNVFTDNYYSDEHSKKHAEIIGDALGGMYRKAKEDGIKLNRQEIIDLLSSHKDVLFHEGDVNKLARKLTAAYDSFVNTHKDRREKVYKHLKSEYEKHGVDLDDSTTHEDADYFNDAATEQGHDDKKLFDEVLANHIKKMKREHPKQEEPEDGGFF